MSKLKAASRYLPILHISKIITPGRSQSISKKIQRMVNLDPCAIAIVVDLPAQFPVQIDKISQSLQKAQRQHKIPIYGFMGSQCSPQSYYLLSIANKIYTSPTAVIQLQKSFMAFQYLPFFQRFKIKRIHAMTKYGLLNQFYERFSLPSQMYQMQNVQYSPINSANNYPILYKKLLKYSIQNRKQIVGSDLKAKAEQVKPVMLGSQLVEQKLADGFGFYEKVLRERHPQGKLMKISYANQKTTILKYIAYVTSPILVLLFLFKVALKWGLIFYAWVKSKAKDATGEDMQSDDDEKQIIIHEGDAPTDISNPNNTNKQQQNSKQLAHGIQYSEKR